MVAECGREEFVLKQNGHKEFTSLSQLTSDPKNARRHTPRNVGTIVDALHEVGAARSIVIDEDGVVLAGNATMDAAIEAGLSKVQVVDGDGETVIAVRRTGLTSEQKTRLALYDNRAAELAEWNPEILAELAPEEIQGMFSDKELAEILSQTGVEPESKDADVDIDKAAELQQKWQVATGEIIEIGGHILLCGDSSKADSYSRLGPPTFDLTLTDPPYNVGVDYGEGKTADQKADFAEWLLPIFDMCMERSKVVMWTPGTVNTIKWILSRPPRWICAWHKSNQCSRSPLGFGAWEPILFYAAGKIGEYAHLGQDAWSIPIAQQEEAEGHPCPKLLDLWQRLIASDVKTILEPFAGSGTTMVAAENLGRQCFAIEISAAYCSLILERMTTAFPHLTIQRHKVSEAA